MRKLLYLMVIIVLFVLVGVCVASSFDENIKWLQNNINNMSPYTNNSSHNGIIDTFKTSDFKFECKNTECKYEREVSWIRNNKEEKYGKTVCLFDIRNIGKASVEKELSSDNYKVYVESMCGQ